MSPWLANSSSISAAVCLLFKISVETKSFSILNLFLHFLHLFVLKHYRIFVTVMQSKFHCCLKFAMSGTYVLHSLMCVVPRVRGLHYTIVTSTSTLEWIALRHAFLLWTNNVSKYLTATSCFIHCNHVFLGWPLGLLPVTIVLSTFLGQVSGYICWTWPYQRRHPHLSAF